jgi:hypothetical protein
MCRILPRFRGGDRTLSLEFVVVELDGAGQMSIPVVFVRQGLIQVCEDARLKMRVQTVSINASKSRHPAGEG